MENCSKLWSRVSRSTQASDAVKNITKVSLRTPGETRWNSAYDAICRLLEPRVKEKLPQIMGAVKLRRFKPIELDVLEEYKQFMKPIADALDKLQGERNCFLGFLMPTVQQVRKKLVILIPKVIRSGSLIERLISNLDRRFPHLFEYNSSSRIYVIAAGSLIKTVMGPSGKERLG